MSIFDNVQKIKMQAPRITLYGKTGMGKSTIASKFPDPFFILTEFNNICGFDATPIFNSFEDFWIFISELSKTETIPYKTIIIDTVSKLDQLVIERVIRTSPPSKKGAAVKTLTEAWGGYGAGFMRAAGIHRMIKMELDKLASRGIIIIYICHVEVKKCRMPDQEDFDMFTIAMNGDLSRPPYTDDVDLVALCKQKSTTIETDSGRNLIKTFDKLILSVGINEAHVSKNRFSMPNEIDMNYDEIKKYIPFLNEEK